MLYICVLTAVLPWYTKGSFWKIGDEKYHLFFNCSLFCLGLAAGVALLPKPLWAQRRLSKLDVCMLVYAGASILSALWSSYPETAWRGYQDWYMGAISQGLFVGIYFLISRYWDGKDFPLWIGVVAMIGVILLGFLNRLGLDPLGMYRSFNEHDWEYSHMLSTIGNINWLCGYLSMALIFPVARYFQTDSGLKKYVSYGVSVPGLALLCVQGSDSGLVLAVLFLILPMVFALSRKTFQRTLSLAGGTALFLAVFGRLVGVCDSLAATPADGLGREILSWDGWWIVAAVLFAGCLGIHLLQTLGRPKEWEYSWFRRQAGCLLRWIGVLVILSVVGVFVWYYLVRENLPDGWASDRGALWKLAWKGFAQGNIKQKLLGAGPDCFAEYLAELSPRGTAISDADHWAGAIYANAHNEWLNQLVNTGLIGTVCYGSIFYVALQRFRDQLPARMAVCIYLIHSLVSFQQVLNAPLFFLLLGLGEKNLTKETESVYNRRIKRFIRKEVWDEVGKI